MKIFERMSSYESIDVPKFCMVFPLKSKGMTSRWPFKVKKTQKRRFLAPPRRISCLIGFTYAWKVPNTAYNIRIHQWTQIGGLSVDNQLVIAPGKFRMMFFEACSLDNHWSKSFFNTGKHSRNVYYCNEMRVNVWRWTDYMRSSFGV